MVRTARGGAARRAEPDHAIRGGRRAGALSRAAAQGVPSVSVPGEVEARPAVAAVTVAVAVAAAAAGDRAR